MLCEKGLDPTKGGIESPCGTLADFSGPVHNSQHQKLSCYLRVWGLTGLKCTNKKPPTTIFLSLQKSVISCNGCNQADH